MPKNKLNEELSTEKKLTEQEQEQKQKQTTLDKQLWDVLDDDFDEIKKLLDLGANPSYEHTSGPWNKWSMLAYSVYNIYHSDGDYLTHYCKVAEALIVKMTKKPDFSQTFPSGNYDKRLRESFLTLLVMRYLDDRSYSLASLTINRWSESFGGSSSKLGVEFHLPLGDSYHRVMDNAYANKDSLLQLITCCLKEGSNPNQKTHNGCHLLLFATAYQNKTLANLLLSYGANPNQQYPLVDGRINAGWSFIDHAIALNWKVYCVKNDNICILCMLISIMR